MWLYKDGQEVYCDKEQVPQFMAEGWSKTKELPEVMEVPEPDESAAAAPKKILKKIVAKEE